MTKGFFLKYFLWSPKLKSKLLKIANFYKMCWPNLRKSWKNISLKRSFRVALNHETDVAPIIFYFVCNGNMSMSKCVHIINNLKFIALSSSVRHRSGWLKCWCRKINESQVRILDCAIVFPLFWHQSAVI